MARAEDFNDSVPSRFVVGIDLGTTNSAVCYVDTESIVEGEPPTGDWQIRVFSIPQWVAVGQCESRDTLPSFHFQPPASEDGAVAKLPWEQRASGHIVGAMARDEGQLAPGRLIGSAKSWLCHHGVDRSADLLPWQGAADVERLSPIEVSARYLRHVRQAWDHQFSEHPLADQSVVLTLPASFDEVARELTVQAAASAGLPRVVLIEEPQAAFYAWVDRHRDDWHQLVRPGQKILVCDIGGGTSDFTLIRVRRAEVSDAAAEAQGESDPGDSDRVQFHRIAVGDHVILGGDNLDLALAHFLEQKFSADGTTLEPRQWDVLVRACRQAKEALLGTNPPESLTVNLPGAGRRLIGGGLQVQLTRDEVRKVLIDGFFPQVQLDDKPQRQSGFQEFGLPYASDPAITKHVGAFLTSHRFADGEPEQPLTHDNARPDLILFNGGVFYAPAIQTRLVEVIASWFQTADAPEWQPAILANDRLNLAVAHGAAYYGMVRRGQGVRIAAGLARSYYLEIGQADDDATDQAATSRAICVVPGSAQPGDTIALPNFEFQLLISEPVEFPLHVSSVRLTDEPGAVIEIDPDQMRPLPPLRTALRTQRRSQTGSVPVRLHAQLSELGTIELWCSQVDGDRQWRLQFDVRSSTETDRVAEESTGEQEGVFDEALWAGCAEVLSQTFGESPSLKPGKLMYRLTESLEMPRDEWPMSLLRRIWETLIALNEGRRHSAAHEARWLNLLGYALRPGFGLAVDDWRVTETWRLVQGKLVHPAAVCRNESWVLWRRIAAGLPAGQQRALAEPLLASTRALHRRMVAGHVRGEANFTIAEFSELWRLLASLELLPNSDKAQLGKMLVELLPKRKIEPVLGAVVWAIGRLGSRVPLYGPLNTVVQADTAGKWVDALCAVDADDKSRTFAVVQLARMTGDRHRDIKQGRRDRVVDWLTKRGVEASRITLVTEGGELDSESQQAAFGESLPKGLVLST